MVKYFMINQTKVYVKKMTLTVHYNAVLAIICGIKGTTQIKLYNELGLEYLMFRW